MSAAQDLRDLRDDLDGSLVGWSMPSSIKASTKTGEECRELMAQVRRKLYAAWSENCALRARLAAALKDNDGLRQQNAVMTEELERRPTIVEGIAREMLGRE